MARVPLGQKTREADDLVLWPASVRVDAELTWSRNAIADAEVAQLFPSLENAEGVVVRRDDPATLRGPELKHWSPTIPDHILNAAPAKLSVFPECVHLERARSI